MSELRERIKETIEQEPVVAFVKGTHEQVYCGNSDRALQALRGVGASFAAVDVLPDRAIRQELSALRAAGAPVSAVDILPDPEIRQELSSVSGWPTIPQVFVKGELIGGADIVQELAATGELEATLDEKLGDGWRGAGEEHTVAVSERATPFRVVP